MLNVLQNFFEATLARQAKSFHSESDKNYKLEKFSQKSSLELNGFSGHVGCKF